MTGPWQTERIGPPPFLAVDHLGKGELLVLLHGIGGNRTNWHDQLPHFGRHFHAVAWDARGYGDSDDYEGPLAFSDYAHDLARLLDHFGSERAHVVGLSMGGRIAMDFAEKYPQRLITLTLCDTHTGYANLSEEKRREFVRLRKEPLIQGAEPRDIAVPVARSLIGPKSSEAAFQRLVESLSRLHKESYIKSIEATVMSPPQTRLSEIQVPTHVVVGGDDRLTTPDMMRDLARAIPGAVLTVIPDAGHLVNIERPQEFNAAVLEFLLGDSKGAR